MPPASALSRSHLAHRDRNEMPACGVVDVSCAVRNTGPVTLAGPVRETGPGRILSTPATVTKLNR